MKSDSLVNKEFNRFDENTKQTLAKMFVDMTVDAGEKLSTIKEAAKTEKITTGKGGVRYSYVGSTKDGRRCYQSEFGGDVSLDDRIAEFKKRIATVFNLGAVELKTDVKKIKIRGDKFTSQKNLFGDSKAVDGEYAAKINSLYDLADILATSQYDPTATAKEPSYANQNTKPKNAAHKM